MSSLKLVIVTTLTFVFATSTALWSQEVTTETGLGEKLLRQLWSDMSKPDIKAVKKTMAQGFQSVHQYGASNRKQEIKLIKKLNLGKYTLSNIKITQEGPVIIASYSVSVEETIKGKRLSKKPAPRLSVFLKTDNGWKWIAHANIKALK